MARFPSDSNFGGPVAPVKSKDFDVHVEEVVTVTYVVSIGYKRRIRVNKQELIALRDALPAQYASLR